jgi:hypothetical protein
LLHCSSCFTCSRSRCACPSALRRPHARSLRRPVCRGRAALVYSHVTWRTFPLCNSEIQLILYTSFKITPFLLWHQIGLFGSTSEQPKQVHSTNSEFFLPNTLSSRCSRSRKNCSRGADPTFFIPQGVLKNPCFRLPMELVDNYPPMSIVTHRFRTN